MLVEKNTHTKMFSGKELICFKSTFSVLKILTYLTLSSSL